jgi:hypothetical protein
MDARCPHCQQVFATQQYGVQPCPSCGQTINVPPPEGVVPPPPAVLPPPPGIPAGTPPSGERGPLPWERRQELGLLQAFWQHTWLCVSKPEVFWSTMRPSPPGTLTEAMLYAWLVSIVGQITAIPWAILQFKLNSGEFNKVLSEMPDNPFKDQLESFFQNPGTWLVGMIIAGLIFFPISYVIQAGLLHLSALICGAGKNGFDTTARIVG